MYPTSARFREVVRGSHRMVARARVLTGVQFGRNPVGLDLPLRSGNVRMASTQDVKATLEIEVPGDYWDSVQPYGAEIFVERGVDFGDGSEELVPLGYFRIQSADQDTAPHGPIKVTGRDRIAQLKDARLVYPYQYPAGISHRELFARMVNGYTDPTGGTAGGPLLISYGMYLSADVPIIFRGYDGDQAKLPTGVIEDDVYEALAKIVDARGCVIMFNRHGELEVVRRDVAPDTAPVYSVVDGKTGTLLRRSRQTRRDGVYNIVVTRGSDPAAPVGYRLSYNNDQTSKLWWKGPFGPVPRYYASPLVRTGEQAQAAGDALLARYSGLPTEQAAAMVPDPSLDLLDPVTLDGALHVTDELLLPVVSGQVELKTRSTNVVPDNEDDGDSTGGSGDGGQGSGSGGDTGTGDGGGTGTPGGPPIFPAQFKDGTPFPHFPEPATNQPIPVANTSELVSKLAAAAPGHTLVLADGTYSPGILAVTRKGTKTQPIVVKAANPGGAKLASGSGFSLRGEWLLVKDITKEHDDAGKSFAVEGAARYCGYEGVVCGPTSRGAAGGDKSLHFYGGGTAEHFFFTFCETRNKSRPGNGVLIDGNFSGGATGGCKHWAVDHLKFTGYGTEAVNDFEAVRLGVSTMQTTPANGAIFRCYFEDVLTEPEIISIKFCDVESWGHTVVKCIGSLSIRHGDRNAHRDCYVIGPATGSGGTKAGGARVYGKQNEITNCYFEGLNGSSYESTLTIDGGDTSSPTNGHQNVVGGRFTDHLMVNCATAVVVGEHYSTAPSGITVTGIRAVACGGAAVRTVKAPKGTNNITDNVHYATLAEAQAAGLTGPTGGAYRMTGKGPRLTRLTAADVGRGGNRADGTGASLGGASGGTGGTIPARVQAAQAILARMQSGQTIAEDWTWTGAPAVVGAENDNLLVLWQQAGAPTPVTWLQVFVDSNGTNTSGTTGGGAATSIASLLKIGLGPGLLKTNCGIGYEAGDPRPPGTPSGMVHSDLTLQQIIDGVQVPGYFELTPDGKRVRFTAHSAGGTTKGSAYPRSELRFLAANATTGSSSAPKESFNPNAKGTHYIIARGRVTQTYVDKPEGVLLQYHDAEDDVAMVRMRNKTTVEAKLGDTVLGNLTTSLALGTDYTWMIAIEGDGSKSRLKYYWNDMATPKFTTGWATRSEGWYGKCGAYGQSWSGTGLRKDKGPTESDARLFVVELSGVGSWHPGDPEPLGLKP